MVPKCSEPIESLKNIQSILLMKSRPFAKRTCLSGRQESVVHKPELKKTKNRFHKGLPSP